MYAGTLTKILSFISHSSWSHQRFVQAALNYQNYSMAMSTQMARSQATWPRLLAMRAFVSVVPNLQFAIKEALGSSQWATSLFV